MYAASTRSAPEPCRAETSASPHAAPASHIDRLAQAMNDPSHPDAEIFAYGPRIQEKWAAYNEVGAVYEVASRVYSAARILLKEPEKVLPVYGPLREDMTIGESWRRKPVNQVEVEAYEAAYAAYRASLDRLREEHANVFDLERRCNRLQCPHDDLVKAACSKRAVTLEGLLFKVKLMVEAEDYEFPEMILRDLKAMLKSKPKPKRRAAH